MAQKSYLDKPGLQEVLLKIKEKFAPIEALIFKGTVADIAHLPALADQKAGWMYNVTKGGPTGADNYQAVTVNPGDNPQALGLYESPDGGTTFVPTTDTTVDGSKTYYELLPSDFVEGAGKMLRDGDNVAAINVGTEEDPVYKWDIISGVFKIEDRLQFGFEMPADPEDEQVFLYLGDTTYQYPAVSPAPTPDSDPATLGLFEKDATLDKYTESADDHLVTGKTYFTISADASTPPTSDPADEGYYELDTTGGVNTYTKTTDTSVDSGKTYYLLTIAEATVTRGDDPQASGWYVDDGTGNYELTTDTYVVSGTTYHTKEEEFVEGVIYQYDAVAAKWNSKTAGDTFTRITEAEIDAMFDNL